MQVFVRGVSQTHVVDVDDSETLHQLKARLAALEGAPADELRLSIGGRPVADDAATLGAAGVGHLCSLDLDGRLVGGKVHGSLARAGKVRGQTPKVEPQEKKKKKTGRAKRRIQYNRRFVNVAVQAPGRRRGPNANS